MIQIYTDGSCIDNPGGPGGWAAVVVHNVAERRDYEVFSGHEPSTTNNRMEIQAVIGGLNNVDAEEPVIIFSDSKYVINTMTKGWKKKANHDLWLILAGIVHGRDISWEWVRGHDGNTYNEIADRVAYVQATTILKNDFAEPLSATRGTGSPA